MRRAVFVVAVVCLALSGCAGDDRLRGGGSINGNTMTVYSLLPDPSRGFNHDLVAGQKLALAEQKGTVNGIAISFASLSDGSLASGDRTLAQADIDRQVANDTQLIAVIGGLDAQTAMVALPLFNAAGVLYLSPGVGYRGFNQRVSANEPERYYPSGVPNFARLGGDDAADARALITLAHKLGPQHVAIGLIEEDSFDGRMLAVQVRQQAAAAHVTVRSASARAAIRIYAGNNPQLATEYAERTARDKVQVIFPDQITRAGLRLSRLAQANSVFLSATPVPDSTPALRSFTTRFRHQFARTPGPYAVLGYEAMRSVLAAIKRAGPMAYLRPAVLQAFFSTPRHSTLLGPYGGGQSKRNRYVAYRYSGAQPQVVTTLM